MDWFSLLLPFGYLTVLVLSLATFSHLYRRRKALAATRLKPWFPPHTTRDIYLTLLEQASTSTSTASKSQSNEKTVVGSTPKIPDAVLRAALLRRAATDIHRLIQIRNAKPALGQLLQRGAVGDELWQRFQIAEKEMESELKEVVAEANALAPNWGQTIFQSAGECAHADHLREKLAGIEEDRQAEREQWEQRRETMKGEFLREIEGGGTELAAPEKMSGAERKPGSSDEDGVLVEAGGPAAVSAGREANSAGGAGGSAKKKKGKR